MATRSKKYKLAIAKVDRVRLYPLEEAVPLVQSTSYSKFSGTVEMAVNLGVDPKQADQNIRGATPLPHGKGKTVRIVVFAKGEKANEAQAAGVEQVGGQELADKILGGWMEFDQVVATPDMMGIVGKLGRVLGPRGLMPNPKLGTVTFELKKAIDELKAGRAEFRVDKAGIVHIPVGKTNMGKEQLLDNIKAVLDALVKHKPVTSKGMYLRKMALSATMSPGVRVDLSPFR